MPLPAFGRSVWPVMLGVRPLLAIAVTMLATLASLTLVNCAPRADRHVSQAGQPTLPEGRNGQLLAAAVQGDIFKVQELLDEGADVNARASNGTTPLMGAAYAGYPRTALLLIRRGAEVGAKSADGLTALHYAAGQGNTEIVGDLLDAGADPNAKTNDGATPLMSAAEAGHERTAERLIAGGATRNAGAANTGSKM